MRDPLEQIIKEGEGVIVEGGYEKGEKGSGRREDVRSRFMDRASKLFQVESAL